MTAGPPEPLHLTQARDRASRARAKMLLAEAGFKRYAEDSASRLQDGYTRAWLALASARHEQVAAHNSYMESLERWRMDKLMGLTADESQTRYASGRQIGS